MNIKLLSLLVFISLFQACRGQQSDDKDQTTTKKQFEIVAVPSVITEPEQRAEYLANHYWDKFDFKDTTNIYNPDIAEQALSNYIGILAYVSPEVASASIKKMMHSAAADSVVFDYFARQYEKYLFDPNSPMRNEALYIDVLHSIVEENIYNEVYMFRPKKLLELALKNRPGEVAIDFVYTTENGKKSKMSQLKTDKLILFFYNPDCEACKETTQKLMESSIINNNIKDGRVKVLAFYPDEDVEAWHNHTNVMPKNWINSYDDGSVVKNNEEYDTKAMPTLYLLDNDKKVILKDATFEQIESYFSK